VSLKIVPVSSIPEVKSMPKKSRKVAKSTVAKYKVCRNCGGELLEDEVTKKTSQLLIHEENSMMKCPVGNTWAKER
jgi:hypothetical protein